MGYVVGVVLALIVCGLARWSRFDRDRAFYPTMVAVVASYYVLFAAISDSTHALIVEVSVMAAFLVMAFLGFRFSLWWAVAALAGHGLFDAVHGHLVTNPGLPPSWPSFCMAFDVVAALVLAVLL